MVRLATAAIVAVAAAAAAALFAQAPGQRDDGAAQCRPAPAQHAARSHPNRDAGGTPQAAQQAWNAVVVGATGETGRHVVRLLAHSSLCTGVTAVVRRELSAEDAAARWGVDGAAAAKVRQAVVDFDKLAEHKEAFAGHSRGFCLLGTTRAKAGSDEAFRRVDYDYVLEAARQMQAGGVEHFSLMTSKGSDASSSFLYMRTKGEIEQAVRDLGFARFSVFRPGLLLTDRNETRIGERVMQAIYPNWALPKSAKAVKTDTVAAAIVANAEREPQSADETYENADIFTCSVGKAADGADAAGAAEK